MILNNQGMSLLLQHRYAEAAAAFEQAIAHDPTMETARANLRIALAWQGRYDEAADYVVQSIESERRRAGGADTPKSLADMNDHMPALDAAGRYAPAEQYARILAERFGAKGRHKAGAALMYQAQVARFVGAVPKVGRTTITVSGEPTLSVIDPDQYRGAIVDLIAADAAVHAAKFGSTYGVDVTGLDRPVEWARAGATEVFLFLPATYVVRRN